MKYLTAILVLACTFLLSTPRTEACNYGAAAAITSYGYGYNTVVQAIPSTVVKTNVVTFQVDNPVVEVARVTPVVTFSVAPTSYVAPFAVQTFANTVPYSAQVLNVNTHGYNQVLGVHSHGVATRVNVNAIGTGVRVRSGVNVNINQRGGLLGRLRGGNSLSLRLRN